MGRTLPSTTVLLSSALLVLTNLSSAGTGAQKTKSAAKAEATKAAVQQLVPLQAPTPEQMPAQPPHITFQNGLLAINADNSNLSDVLRGVRTAMGIGMDTPPGAGSERVVVHLGPGQPRDVMTQLLNGSRYDYILVGTAQDPQGISQVILTLRQSTTVAGNAPPSAPVQQNYSAQNASSGDDDSDSDDTAQQPEPSASPQLPPANPYQPNNQGQAGGPPQPPGGGGETGGQQVKTPEQLLQELQRMQQQQQQQQQQQSPNRPQ